MATISSSLKLSNADIIETTSNPSIGGTTAGLATLALANNNGTVWVKTGSTGQDWSRVIVLSPALTSFQCLIPTDGYAATPILIFGNNADTDTGFYHPTDNTLAVSTSGSERWRVNADGYFGMASTAPSSFLQVSGSFSVPLRTVTGNTTLNVGDYTVLANATSNAITIALPSVASITGRIYVIKKMDVSANTITIDANGSETIDGSLTQTLSTIYESITIQSSGSQWVII